MVKFERTIFLTFVIISVLLGLDLYSDFQSGSSISHVLKEGAALLLSFAMFNTYLIRFYRNVQREKKSMAVNFNTVCLDRDNWKKKSETYLDGLGKLIDEQFELWSLSESERDIGLLILKGMTHKEIATIRETSEKTVRQQATSLYSKAGIENKSQLSAFFLEDLLLPSKRNFEK